VTAPSDIRALAEASVSILLGPGSARRCGFYPVAAQLVVPVAAGSRLRDIYVMTSLEGGPGRPHIFRWSHREEAP